MRICFFGTYAIAEGYPVNRVLVRGLRRAGAQVEECREELWGGFLHEALGQRGALVWLRVGGRALRAYTRLLWRYGRAGEHCCVVVGYAGYFDVLLARLLNLFRRRLLVLVAFISLYDTAVVDRGRFRDSSWKAALLKWIDRTAFRAADLVLVDTEEQRRYFARLFDLPEAKFQRSLVGNDFQAFGPAPLPARKGKLQVLFFGTYVPLHGIEHILAAAHLLRGEEVEFTLIGSGQLYPQMRREAGRLDLERVHFVDAWVDTGGLAAHMRRADVCLGIFGGTSKAGRVIPYKVFGALAMGRPLITRDSPAARELLADGESALLCAPSCGEALAACIERLRKDEALARRIAQGGHARYCQQASDEAIGRTLLKSLEARCGG